MMKKYPAASHSLKKKEIENENGKFIFSCCCVPEKLLNLHIQGDAAGKRTAIEVSCIISKH